MVRKEEIQLQDASPDFPKRLSQNVENKIEVQDVQNIQTNNNRSFNKVALKKVEKIDENDEKKCCLKKNKKKKTKCDQDLESEASSKASRK